ncbi:hypothetical protein [Streptomyces cavernae]|uniref:hypothetical protein n=1 Tax=Streptomyces cavernae TaxID=2259034 RepID=UPI000FEBC7CC|nr:hypothetical protein [Streptomyces cavernae]
MTSTTDTAGHPEVAEISDLTEGLLPPSRNTDVRRHLDDCSLCADVYDSLEEIRGLLGSLPGPPRMPADVAGRIDAALAAEALLSAAATVESTDTPNTTSVAIERSEAEPLSPASGDAAGPHPESLDSSVAAERDGERVSRETSSTGTATERPAGHARAVTGPGRKPRSRRARRRTIVFGTVLTAAVLGLGGVFVQGMVTDDSGDTPAANSNSKVTFSQEKLEKEVEDLLSNNVGAESVGPREKGPFGGTPGEEAPPTEKSPRTLFKNTPKVPSCVRQGIDSDDDAIAAKQGDYDGKSAYLVVLPHASDIAKVSAYVVDATCVKQPSEGPGKVLLTKTFARP